jgi:hypothetical protein
MSDADSCKKSEKNLALPERIVTRERNLRGQEEIRENLRKSFRMI